MKQAPDVNSGYVLEEERMNNLNFSLCMVPFFPTAEIYYFCSKWTLQSNTSRSGKFGIALCSLISGKLHK